MSQLPDSWDALMPRLLHDARALLRKAAIKTQMLQRAADDPTVLEPVVGRHADLDRFLVRVGLLADARSSAARSEPLTTCKMVVAAVEKQWQPDIAQAGGELVTGSPVPDAIVAGAARTILDELIDNAIRFRSPERPLRISLRCTREEEQICFAVADNGTGWNDDYRERLFQPFERLDAERGGSGLGLALCKALSAKHGGAIHATTSEAGSTVSFTLPAAS